MSTQTAIFSKLVKDFMRDGSPLAVSLGTSCEDLARAMEREDVSSATVTDSQDHPVGIITEQDISRRAAFRVSGDTPVDEVMTAPVLTIAGEEYLYHAIARMRRRGLRHMPVVDDDGVLMGMLDLHAALAVAAGPMMDRIDRLTHEGALDGLKQVKAAQVELADELFDEHLPAPEIQALLTHINNDIYRRIIDQCLLDMEGEGLGTPPVPFTAIVFGSGGRGENYLFPDQDNGFILGDYDDADHTRIDGFFIELAERMTHDLDAVGLPYCNGYCMAVNPLWRKTISQWKEQIHLWGRKRNFVAIRLSDIFFDFQPVWGDPSLARELRGEVTTMIQSNHFFLKQIFHEVEDHNVALGIFGGFFGSFITEQEKEEYKGQINLKHTGTLPLVETIRLLSLREGVEETATLKRIEALCAKDILKRAEADHLAEAFTYITGILLRQQIHDFKAGNKVAYYVDPESLQKRGRAHLTEALRDIDELREKVKADFTAEIF